MDQRATKVPVKTEERKPEAKAGMLQPWQPFASLRREVDRLFEDFDHGFWRAPFRRFDIEPFWQREFTFSGAPAVDIVEKDKAYEMTAELPGLDEKDIEVKLSNGDLMIKGEKNEEKEEKKKDYYLRERKFGSFERCFRLPEGVESDKIVANFKKGVLTVTLPKKAGAQKPEKKIEVKVT